jgi:hypothetical protein
MAFRMKVEDVFVIGKRTVFVGELKTDVPSIKGVVCDMEIDGKLVSQFVVEGEVQTGMPNRDLWTTAEVKS